MKKLVKLIGKNIDRISLILALEEKDRVLKACDFLRQGDIRSFGKLMFRTQ